MPVPTPSSRVWRIGFVAEYKEDYLAKGWSKEQVAEFDSYDEVEALVRSIESLGHTVDRIGNIESLTKRIAEGTARWDFVWSISEGNTLHEGREAQVPCLLEAFGIPFTFSDAATMALLMNKAKTKMVLEYHGIPTAPYAVIPRYGGGTAADSVAKSPHRDVLTYPLFLKPACEGNSKGIHGPNKVWNDEQLNHAASTLQKSFPKQDILIERFLEGRDFTVLIVGTRESARVLGVLEHVWVCNIKEGKCKMPDSATVWSCKGGELVAGLPASMGKEVAENGCHPELEVFDYTLKNEWYWKGPPPILLVKGEMNDPVIQRVAGVALKAYQALDCFDCSRIDVRHDVWGPDAIPNVIEFNPIPGMQPVNSCFSCIVAMNGLSHQEAMREIIDCVVERIRDNKPETNGRAKMTKGNGHS